MGIRKYNKDRLPESASLKIAPPTTVSASHPVADEPLQFWTLHATEPTLVDLTPFREGQYESPLGRAGTWTGPFTGRPALITQLGPAIRTICELKAEKTVDQYVHSLRTWWRLFDAVEEDVAKAGRSISPVKTIDDITEIHRQRAFDEGMSNASFVTFVKAINLVRVALHLPKLYWSGPDKPSPTRHLPPKWQVDQVRFALKHNWFAVLNRWALAEQLREGRHPESKEEARLQKNYQRFQSVMERTENPKPDAVEVWGDLKSHVFNRKGFSVPTMLRGVYPDASDIRVAFHLCLANTGWNPAVLTSLNITNQFIEPHPKDASRYLMHGYKARGESEQITEGLFKSQGSAGVVLQTLMKRTEPLRDNLRAQLVKLREAYKTLKSEGATSSIINRKLKHIVKLERGVRSPWLYVTSKNAIAWLDNRNYFRGLDRRRDNGFIAGLIYGLNERRPPDKQLSLMKSSDFRDAFATYAYQVSGGMVLYVMKALGHKSLKSTQIYLDNAQLNDESAKLFGTYSNALWKEIREYGRVDPTIIAKWSRDGSVSVEERGRLHDYRTLRRSRIGVGCKDPTRPPSRIAPAFKADGKAMCPVQRCTLCLEHAVIFPDSLSGLCQRLAELRVIKSQMPTVAFLESSFDEEITNTELALTGFNKQDVLDLVASWEHRIVSGEHRVIEFEGIQKVEA